MSEYDVPKLYRNFLSVEHNILGSQNRLDFDYF